MPLKVPSSVLRRSLIEALQVRFNEYQRALMIVDTLGF